MITPLAQIIRFLKKGSGSAFPSWSTCNIELFWSDPIENFTFVELIHKSQDILSLQYACYFDPQKWNISGMDKILSYLNHFIMWIVLDQDQLLNSGQYGVHCTLYNS